MAPGGKQTIQDAEVAFAASELSAKLKRLRQRSGLSGRQIAVRAAMSQSKLSKIETGALIPTERDVLRILDAIDVTRSVARSLVSQARTLDQLRLGAVETPTQVDVQKWLREMEGDSGSVIGLCAQSLQGVLQTPEYMQSAYDVTVSLRGERSALISVRQARRKAALQRSKETQFVVPERLLRPGIASPKVMEGQLEQIASDLKSSKFEIGVIPEGVPTHSLLSEVVMFEKASVLAESAIANRFLRSDDADLISPFADQVNEAISSAVWEREAYELVRENLRRLAIIDVRSSKTFN